MTFKNGDIPTADAFNQVIADAQAAGAAAVAYIYTGTYPSAPTTRPDGSPIQNGDRYINSTDGYEYTRISGFWTSQAGASAASLADLKNRYMGAYASDPTTRPDGSALTVGCSYFNTTSNLFMVFNGATFQASDINTANLAASSGSSLVGFIDSRAGAVPQTIQDVLREAVSVKRFGAKGDGVTDDTAALQLAINLSATVGFVARAPAGTYNHTGLTYKNGSRLRGDGSVCTRLVNTSTTSDSIHVPYNNDGVFFQGWEISGLTLDAQTHQSASQAGFRLDTCVGGIVRDIVTENHYYGWREKSSWDNEWSRVRVTGCVYAALVESGSSTGGVPNYRFSTFCVNNTYGIDIQDNGLSATIFVGGQVGGCANWALRILGSSNRAIKFVGYNFENNANASVGYDVIVGDDSVSTSGPSNVEFDSCQFTDPDLSGDRKAFDLNRGSSFELHNCYFIGYASVISDLSTNFGGFSASGNAGATYFGESATTGVNLPLGGRLYGTKSSACAIEASGTVRVYQQSSTNSLLASRRTTESYDRFEIDPTGKLGWHAFNSASADVHLDRRNTQTLETDGAFGVGSFATASLPAAGTAGAGALAYDSTVGALKSSNGSVWSVLGNRVAVPANSSASGVAGQWSADDSYFYVYGATGWRRVATGTF